MFDDAWSESRAFEKHDVAVEENHSLGDAAQR